MICSLALFGAALQTGLSCMAVKIGNSFDGPPVGDPPGVAKICPSCPSVYAENCNGLEDRYRCYNAAKAKVHRQEIPGVSCVLTYKCPEPLVAYVWLEGATSVQVLNYGKLICTEPKPFWRMPNQQALSKFACMSRPETKICPKCPGIYVANCNGLKDRVRCWTAAQAQLVRTENAGKSCVLTYKCPEPVLPYAWPKGAANPQVLGAGKLICTAAKPVWRTPALQTMTKMTCMSRPQTRCIDVYQAKQPCQRSKCATRKEVSLRVFRDPNNGSKCLLQFTCPAGTSKYIYEGVGKGYVGMTNEPITCLDNGPGSSWETSLAPPFEVAYVNHVSCFSAT